MQGRLTYKTGSLDEEQLLVGYEATIGKDVKNNVVIKQREISRRHARIFLDETHDCYYLEDLNSQNGTYLDGEKISAAEPLSNIHIITLGGQFDLFFQVLKNEPRLDRNQYVGDNRITIVDEIDAIPEQVANGFSDRPYSGFDEMAQELLVGDYPANEIVGLPGSLPASETGIPAIPESEIVAADHSPFPSQKETLPAFDVPRQMKQKPPNLEIDSGFVLNIKGLNERYTLKEGGNIIGRVPKCNVVIGDQTISRKHACILIEDNVISVNDLGSKNCTFLGKKKIRRATQIGPNTRLRFGDVEAVLSYDE